MLALIICLAGILAILLVDEYLGHKKILRAEYKRKFVHIVAGAFIAFWPWLVSWRQIQLLGLAMLAVVILNRRLGIFNFMAETARIGFGDVFLALAVTLSAALTSDRVFFMLAILTMALADGLAAVIGKHYGSHWKYKVFGQKKTLVGTMTFWLVALLIFGFSMPLVAGDITPQKYILLLVVLPPVLTITENLAAFGLDNLAIPLLTLLALKIA
ncbi:hypothetical protein EPN29_14300 [bacterium]|nr:MAG: hypothetical protein EPN29_14300 [bacterium]